VLEGEKVADPGIDAVFVCVLDDLHAVVVKSLAPLGLHIMCEKPLDTQLQDLLGMYAALSQSWAVLKRKTLFTTGYVLRYSKFFMLLRRLLREERVIGDVISVEHTEPVGWWHFEHAYVRYVYSLTSWYICPRVPSYRG
jgi:predicted dehydrogenase